MSRSKGSLNRKGSLTGTSRAYCIKCGKRRYVSTMHQFTTRPFYYSVPKYICDVCYLVNGQNNTPVDGQINVVPGIVDKNNGGEDA